VQFRVPAEMSEVTHAIEQAQVFATEHSLTADAGYRLKIVVEELVRNVVLHGVPPPGSAIDMSMDRDGASTVLRSCDKGVAFDPRTDLPLVDRDTTDVPDVEGGVGWPLILHWCRIDTVERIGDENQLQLHLPDRQD